MNTQEKENFIKMILEEIKKIEDFQSENNLTDDDYICIDTDFLEWIEKLDNELSEFLKKYED